MAKVVAKRLDCTGKRVEVWVEGWEGPLSFPGDDPKAVDDATIDKALAAVTAQRDAQAKMAEIDVALQAELEKRKAAATDLYAKSATDAVTAVFPTVTGGTK